MSTGRVPPPDWRALVEEGYKLLQADRWEEALDRFERGLADLGPCDTATHVDHMNFDRIFPHFAEDRSRCLWRCVGILGELMEGMTAENALSPERIGKLTREVRSGRPHGMEVVRALLGWSLAAASRSPGEFKGMVRPFLARTPGLSVSLARRFLTKLKGRLQAP